MPITFHQQRDLYTEAAKKLRRIQQAKKPLAPRRPAVAKTLTSKEQAQQYIASLQKAVKKAQALSPLTKAPYVPRFKAPKPPKGKEWMAQPVKTVLSKGRPKGRPGAGLVSKPVRPTAFTPVLAVPQKRMGRGGTFAGVDLEPVVSSNVSAIGYDEEEHVLFIKFHDFSVYRYEAVPKKVWNAFQVAPSKGKFVWAHIRDQYPYRMVI